MHEPEFVLEPVLDLVVVVCEAEDVLQENGEREVHPCGGFGDGEVPAVHESVFSASALAKVSLYHNWLRP